jgi:histidine triad (HIT) family protein
MTEKTIFEKIVAGEIPSFKIYEDEICLAIVDKFPTTEGQCLIFPKKCTPYMFDLDEETYNHLFKIAKQITKSLDKSFNPIRTCLAVEGFEVPHAHIKLFPVQNAELKTGGGTEIDSTKATEIQNKIIANL